MLRTEPSKAWSEFDIQIPTLATAIFNLATGYDLGSEEKARFWRDRWLPQGRCVEEVAPNLLLLVPKRKVNARSVKEGLEGLWLMDCGPDLGEEVLPEFFYLWHLVSGVQLVPDREDKLVWWWSYAAFFAGWTRPPVVDQI